MTNNKTVTMHDITVKEICDLIDNCKGDVFLETAEGDRLNLKSKLSQLLGLTSLIEAGKISEANITCTDPEDEGMLFRYNLFGHK